MKAVIEAGERDGARAVEGDPLACGTCMRNIGWDIGWNRIRTAAVRDEATGIRAT